MSSKTKSLDIHYAIKSFVGYLEGTQKSAHTIKNYRLDLLAFKEFLEKGLGSDVVSLKDVTREDLERFHDSMKSQGLKNNTRRRKILTVRKLLRYLTQRNKMDLDLGKKLPAPHKIERIPVTVPSQELIEAIRALPADQLIFARNRALLWTLAETGCLVSEVTRFKAENYRPNMIDISGKSPRQVPISRDLYDAIDSLGGLVGKEGWLFTGFNKFGSMGSPITPRGVELLVKAYASQLGFQELTPRTFRHSVVIQWHRDGIKKDEIQKRLGLKTAYAFRAYDPIFKAHQIQLENQAQR